MKNPFHINPGSRIGLYERHNFIMFMVGPVSVKTYKTCQFHWLKYFFICNSVSIYRGKVNTISDWLICLRKCSYIKLIQFCFTSTNLVSPPNTCIREKANLSNKLLPYYIFLHQRISATFNPKHIYKQKQSYFHKKSILHFRNMLNIPGQISLDTDSFVLVLLNVLLSCFMTDH